MSLDIFKKNSQRGVSILMLAVMLGLGAAAYKTSFAIRCFDYKFLL